MKRKTILILPALAASLWLMPLPSAAAQSSVATQTRSVGARSITRVEPIRVECPEGTAPRLPYQVWVTYSDGRSEYRQTRWSNAARAVEEEQADPARYPAGREYTVGGFITGDNTTANGFPITARVTVVARPSAIPSPVPVAETLPLEKVVINGDNRLTSNRELAIREIISWDVSQQLYNYRDTYGLPTEGYTVSDGWDSPVTKLKGHGSGHYMSALALAFASTDNPDYKKVLRAHMTRMVNELRACQEKTFVWNEQLGRYWEARDFAPENELLAMKGTWADFDVYKTAPEKYGYGYLNAIPAQHPALIEAYRAYNNESWVWAPYYSIHKQLAGLIEIATHIDDPAVATKALLIAKDMGLWVWNRLHYRTYMQTGGTQEERRARPGNRYEMWNMYIAGEDGGTGESLARLSEMVSDPQDKARLLEASNFFDSPAFYDPLTKNIDDIRTRHANQHIPKIISALRSYRGNKDAAYYHLAQHFWEMIQGRYRYATGGVGNGEMFRQPYTQVLSMSTNGAPTLNETCCAYNLAKLTKDLNCFDPDDARYMDYYECVLYNQLIGSLHPGHYQTTYQYAVGLNASKPWGNETPQSTCCGGTGSENHVKYQEAAYFVSENTLWVALYMPTTLQWDAKGISIRQDCLWPSEHSTFTFTGGKARFAMKLRVPYWATAGVAIKLNGEPVAGTYRPCSYVTIPEREWTSADVVEVTLPFSKHIDFGPDKMTTASAGQNQPNVDYPPVWAGTLMYGPLVMTATGVNDWEEAALTVDAHLESIVLNEPGGGSTGSDGNLYTLVQGGRTFEPDYFCDENTTHYFRINLVDDMTAEFRTLLADKLDDVAMFRPANYSRSSYKTLKTAVDAGRQMLRSEKATQNGITSRIGAIDQALNALKPVKLDKSALTATLREAESKAKSDYTSDKYASLRMAVTAAKEVIETGTSQLPVDKQTLALRKAIGELVTANSVDKSRLAEVMSLAAERKEAQDAWNALSVKVPEYAPWAPHAFERLTEEWQKAQDVYQNNGRNYNQSEVNSAASALNAAINTMRPGNLPEPEDLYPLSTLLRQAGRVIPAEKTPAIREAIEYAEMVVAYVIDGSGTHDMILKATDKLRAALR